MDTLPANGLTIYYPPEERAAAELVRETCAQTLAVIGQRWDLAAPRDCRVYVMTSWQGMLFHAAPWPWRISMALLLPVWALRTRRVWPLAGGWMLSFGRRRTVGVKPPRLMVQADRSIGQRLYKEENSLNEKVRNITAHELTHACTAHLRLPVWLNEGLAMLAADLLLAQDTIRAETLDILAATTVKTNPASYRKLNLRDHDALVYVYARGYWITRYLADAHPALLTQLLARRHRRRDLEAQVAAACGLTPGAFWRAIDDAVVEYFRGRLPG